jgi:hypothetical protein
MQSRIPRRYCGSPFKRRNDQLILICHISFIFAAAFMDVLSFILLNLLGEMPLSGRIDTIILAGAKKVNCMK